ncbi:hypothetical protein FQR65_LT03210 [Abscondita terminalis]|nr:hypothetical protein FQR65_LT03210 [Abscondita terminalis]
MIERPHYYLSKALCVIAYNIDENGETNRSKKLVFYKVRIFVYSMIFIIGNYMVNDVIYRRTLDKIAFLFSNTMLITLTIYIMIWSVAHQTEVVDVVSKLGTGNGKCLEWIEIALLAAYNFSIAGSVAYSSNLNLTLLAEYCILYVSPDIFHYTALFQFINTIIAFRRRIIVLNKRAEDRNFLRETVCEYQKLYLMSTRINKLYGLLCLGTVATFFTWIMCDLYRFMSYLESKIKNDEILISSLIATFAHYVALFYISALCNSTKFHWYSFKIIFCKTILTAKQEHSLKKRLCLSILHQNVQLTAMDWFELDYIFIYTSQRQHSTKPKRTTNVLEVCRRVLSSDAGSHRKKLPPLMNFPEIIWPSLIKSMYNFILSTFIIKPYMDRDFNIPDFVKGSKKAVEVVSNKLSEGNLKALKGLVASEALPDLQKSVSLMSLAQREQLAIDIEDIYFSFPYQVGIIFNDEDGKDHKRFVEITMVYHTLKGLSQMRSKGEEPPLNMGMMPEYQGRISVCNYRFIREFTKGIESEWTVNLLNHFKPADYLD